MSIQPLILLNEITRVNMKHSYNLFIPLLLLIIVSCNKKQQEEALTSINIDENIIDTLEMDLRDLVYELRIVRLETTSSSLLDEIWHGVYRSDKYLVVRPRSETFLFTHDGRFVRNLYDIGRGPEDFIAPGFSPIIKNEVLYIEDKSKSKEKYYRINLDTGVLSEIIKPFAWESQSFIVQNDSTIIAFANGILDHNLPAGTAYEYLKQGLHIIDKKGELYRAYDFGISKPYSFLIFNHGRLYQFSDDIYLRLPRGEHILQIKENSIDTVWTNHFKNEFVTRDKPGSYTDVDLLYFSPTRAILQKQTVIIGNMVIRRSPINLVLVEREKKTAQIMKLFFRNREHRFHVSSWNVTSDGYLFIILYPYQMIELMKDPEMKEYINELIAKGSYYSDEPISLDDNPFLLIGRINDQ